MDDTTQEIVQRFLKYLTERNLTALACLFSETVDWDIPGDENKAPWLGKRSSRQEVSDCYELLWKNTEPVAAHIDHLFTDGENAVITGDFSTKMLATGNIVDSLFCIRMHIRNGKILQYRLLEDSFAVSVALSG